MLLTLVVLNLAVWPGFGQSTSSNSLTLAAASDLQFALPEIVAAYTKSTGIPVRVTYGSSGNLSAQIVNGAPFDALLSADASYPKGLIASGNAVPETLTFYARGCLVVWFGPFAKPSSERPAIADLATTPGIRNIAIANPKHAPYGRAAEAALKSAGIYDRVSTKFVLGENISQTVQFVDSGNAQAGLVALSLLQGAPSQHLGTWRVVPLDTYPALDQAAVVTKRGAQNPAARSFLEYLRSATAQDVFQRFGFRPPSSEPAK
jgi:molybdate transport system substrate-binding protein